MSKIQLITPLEQQKNWGPAINSNFQLLYNKYIASLNEIQALRTRIEELDILKIKQEQFIYLQPNKELIQVPTIGGEVYDKTDAYMANIEDWTEQKFDEDGNPTVSVIEFDPYQSQYVGYDAWFVQTPNDNTVFYADKLWNTGDLLIIHKQSTGVTSLNQQVVIIEQWKNTMGGYYIPLSSTMNSKGKITNKYIKAPSFSTEKTVDIDIPHIYWQPVDYYTGQKDGNRLVFQAKQIDNKGKGDDLDLDQVSLSVPTLAWACCYVYLITAQDNTAIIQNVFDDEKSSLQEEVMSHKLDINISFKNFDTRNPNTNDKNELYFSYTIHKFNRNLEITVDRGAYTGDIYVYATINQDCTDKVQNWIAQLKTEIKQEIMEALNSNEV